MPEFDADPETIRVFPTDDEYWFSHYFDRQDLVFVSDFVTGAWTFKLTPAVADGNGTSNGRGRGN